MGIMKKEMETTVLGIGFRVSRELYIVWGL